jgi:hypothetical protein
MGSGIVAMMALISGLLALGIPHPSPDPQVDSRAGTDLICESTSLPDRCRVMSTLDDISPPEISVDCAADQYLQEASQGPSPVTGLVSDCVNAELFSLEDDLLPGAWNRNPANRTALKVVAPSPLYILIDLPAWLLCLEDDFCTWPDAQELKVR